MTKQKQNKKFFSCFPNPMIEDGGESTKNFFSSHHLPICEKLHQSLLIHSLLFCFVRKRRYSTGNNQQPARERVLQNFFFPLTLIRRSGCCCCWEEGVVCKKSLEEEEQPKQRPFPKKKAFFGKTLKHPHQQPLVQKTLTLIRRSGCCCCWEEGVVCKKSLKEEEEGGLDQQLKQRPFPKKKAFFGKTLKHPHQQPLAQKTKKVQLFLENLHKVRRDEISSDVPIHGKLSFFFLSLYLRILEKLGQLTLI